MNVVLQTQRLVFQPDLISCFNPCWCLQLQLGSRILEGVSRLIFDCLDRRRQHQHYLDHLSLTRVAAVGLDSPPVSYFVFGSQSVLDVHGFHRMVSTVCIPVCFCGSRSSPLFPWRNQCWMKVHHTKVKPWNHVGFKFKVQIRMKANFSNLFLCFEQSLFWAPSLQMWTGVIITACWTGFPLKLAQCPLSCIVSWSRFVVSYFLLTV